MNERQKRFCDEYLTDLNAKQAAIRAGYSEKTAKQIGNENLTKPDLREYIDKRLKEKEESLIAKQDEVMKYLTKVMRREEQEYTVVTLKSRSTSFDGEGRKMITESEEPKIVPIPSKLSDANKAAELLGKRFAMWTDNKNIDVQGVVTFVDDIGEEDET